MAGANLLQQGAGLLNVNGAMSLAKVLRTDVASAIGAGTIFAGSVLLAPGKTARRAQLHRGRHHVQLVAHGVCGRQPRGHR
jgi:hypothetical protein